MKVQITITFELDWDGIEEVSQIDYTEIHQIINRSTLMNYVDGYSIDSVKEIE